MKKQTCYMCDKKATSPEHVPPKCIFSEVKDLGIDYRKSLITVPSCDEHNMRKSKDDEYLMLAVTCNIINNEVAMSQIKSKIKRAWERNPNLSELLLRVNRSVEVNGISTTAFKVDTRRFKRSLEWIARGLYYDQYKKKWSGKIGIESPSMLFLESEHAQKANMMFSQMGAAVHHVLGDLPKIGDNHNVFWYQMQHNEPDKLLINMMFFGGVQILAFSTPRMN